MRSVFFCYFGMFFLFVFFLPLLAQENKPKTSSKAYLKADRRPLTISEQNHIEELANQRGKAMGKQEYRKGSFLSDIDDQKEPWYDVLFYGLFVGCLFAGAFVMAYNYMLGLTANREELIRKNQAELRAQEQANLRRMLEK